MFHRTWAKDILWHLSRSIRLAWCTMSPLPLPSATCSFVKVLYECDSLYFFKLTIGECKVSGRCKHFYASHWIKFVCNRYFTSLSTGNVCCSSFFLTTALKCQHALKKPSTTTVTTGSKNALKELTSVACLEIRYEMRRRFYTEQDWLPKSFSLPTLSTVENSSAYLLFISSSTICFWIDLIRVLATTGNTSAVARYTRV